MRSTVRTISWTPSPPEFEAVSDSAGLFSASGSWIEFLRTPHANPNRESSPDLLGQIEDSKSNPVDALYCSLLDGDGRIRLNASIGARWPADVVRGVAELSRFTRAKKTGIIIESNWPKEWLQPLRAAADAEKIPLIELLNEYPQNDPTLLIYTLLRRKLRPGNLPTSQGAMILDAAAAMHIGRAAQGQIISSVPLGIYDHARSESHFVEAALGTTLSAVFTSLKIPFAHSLIRMGDYLRDVPGSAETVIKNGELTVHLIAAEIAEAAEACIRCGWCRTICPTAVQPALILEANYQSNPKLAKRAGLHACIECGLCDYVCPSRLPLLESIRLARQK